ncbi:E3 ubiquitin-protein ligase TM129 isoform X2 [Lampetra fluviatilis]
MESPEMVFTLAYLLFCVCFLLTPTEFRSAGITVQGLFSGWLGSEDLDFVRYHTRRTTTTMVVHALLPLEFRRIDKFATGPPEARVIVTDSWVVKVTPYKVNVAQQRDIHLTLTESRQHSLSPETSSAIQFLTIRVVSITPGVPAFDIRLNSTEYGELREKLHAPIRNARNVVIHQTLSDLFLEAFKTQVELNDCYYMPVGQPQETEPCIGCMQVPATVKLHKQCDGNAEGECQTCFCRPMWCLTCMGKWFASRQDQQHPEVWLSSRAPCPTCRARFCILDVALVR